MKTVIEIFGSFLVLISLLPLVKTHYWWVRVFDFPRTQVIFFIFLILTAYLCLYAPPQNFELLFVLLLAGTLIMQVIHVLPFTFFSRIEALPAAKHPPEHPFSFMIANVRMTNRKYGAFLKVVHDNDPDLLLINEPDHAWAREIKALDKVYPYCIKCPLDNTYGMMFYSRFVVKEHQINFLIEKDIPSFYMVIELPCHRKFVLFTVHPQPPRFRKNTDTREAELLTVGRMAKASPYPSIVAGDLNDVAWSHTTRLFKRISGLLDPRIGRGFFNTYNARVPFFRYPLDHIFYDPDFRLLQLARLPGFGSDHFPILVKLNYEPAEADAQDAPVADQDDKEEARELIGKVNEQE